MGLTTEELSQRSGIPIGTLNKILSGQTQDPKLETLKSLARVFGCSLDDFDDPHNESSYYEDVVFLIARNGKKCHKSKKLTHEITA